MPLPPLINKECQALLSATSVLVLRASNASVPFHSLDGKVRVAKVVKVYDGDTIHCTMVVADSVPEDDDVSVVEKWSVRLFGIDTCEIRGRTRTVSQRRLAEAAKQFVIDSTLNKLVVLQCKSFDKYGRLMANVWVPPSREESSSAACVNKQLVEHDLAVYYNGGTKGVSVYEDSSELLQSLSNGSNNIDTLNRICKLCGALRESNCAAAPPTAELRRSSRVKRRRRAIEHDATSS